MITFRFTTYYDIHDDTTFLSASFLNICVAWYLITFLQHHLQTFFFGI